MVVERDDAAGRVTLGLPVRVIGNVAGVDAGNSIELSIAQWHELIIAVAFPPVMPEQFLDRAPATTGRVLTCVYCGHEYPQDTPAHGSQVLTDHIKVCEKHPMRKLEADKARLRGALMNLVGADSLEEVNRLHSFVAGLAADEVDKAAILDALAALNDT